jgi:hypothetical protein
MWLSYQHMTSVAAAQANIFSISKSGNKIEENLKIFVEVDLVLWLAKPMFFLIF